MQVKELSIARRPSYDSEFPNQLVGVVTLTGPSGSQTITLSNAALGRIFSVITAEVQDTARRNAEQVRRGLSDAAEEPLLLEASTVQKA